MGINQAIYTSSAKGIEKGGGLGIHSYSPSCSKEELREFEMNYCRYFVHGEKSPAADSSFPTKLLYGKTAEDRYLGAMVTYLGKDYDKEQGRTGNFLSHMYSFEKEELPFRPIQLYGSPDYRIAMGQEEVDGSQRVDFLPEKTSIKKGSEVNIQKIQTFLRDERMEMFCHMLSALFSCSGQYKLIIYDYHENILLWLGALQFALPLQSAREMSFSSFEQNPMISGFDIRGAIPGLSDGDCREYEASGQFYVFDGVHRSYPKFDISGDYFRYGIKRWMAFSHQALENFFVCMEKYDYERVDGEICRGFKLYQLMQHGMEELGSSDWNEAILFEKKYGNKTSYREMLRYLFKNLEHGPVLEETSLGNICSLLLSFCTRRLTVEELEYAVTLAIQLDVYMKKNNANKNLLERMWQKLYQIMERYPESYTQRIVQFFKERGDYVRIAQMEADLIENLDTDGEEVRLVCTFLETVWNEVSLPAYGYFEQVVAAAVQRLEKYEKEQRYALSVSLYLKLCEIGKGLITGRGCENLISMINRDTGILYEKKKNKREIDRDLEYRLAICAKEANRYIRDNHMELSVERLQLHHVAGIMLRSFERSIPLSRSKALKEYLKHPIRMENVNSEEFFSYMVQWTELAEDTSFAREDYFVLLSIWNLSTEQKRSLIQQLIEYGVGCVKSQKQVETLGNFLAVIRDMKDREYEELLQAYLLEMRSSMKKKIYDLLIQAEDQAVVEYWLQMGGEVKKGRWGSTEK